MSNLIEETVTEVHHWTDTLFSFKTTRDSGFRFRSGQFTMIGLPVDGKPLLRAYSVASAHYEENLEFLSIKVQDGPLTSRLQHVKPGDPILISRKATGTLVLDDLLPAKNLWLLSTGTGLAPFMSIIKDPEAYDRFERIFLVHGCRWIDELAYRDFITEELPKNELFGEMVSKQLVYYPTITREEFPTMGRITDLLRSGKIYEDLNTTPICPENDRVMLCGSPAMLAETVGIIEELGLVEGCHGTAGHYVIEKAFVEK